MPVVNLFFDFRSPQFQIFYAVLLVFSFCSRNKRGLLRRSRVNISRFRFSNDFSSGVGVLHAAYINEIMYVSHARERMVWHDNETLVPLVASEFAGVALCSRGYIPSSADLHVGNIDETLKGRNLSYSEQEFSRRTDKGWHEASDQFRDARSHWAALTQSIWNKNHIRATFQPWVKIMAICWI